MDAAYFLQLLIQSPLDRETKLALIDLVSLSSDEKIKIQTYELLREWKEHDTETIRVFQEELDRILKSYESRERALSQKTQHSLLTIADDVQKQSRLHSLRSQMNLPHDL